MRPHFDHGEAAAADVIFQYQGRFLRGGVMGSQSGRGQSDAYESETVIPFGHTPKNGNSNEAAQLDNAGQAIMRLLHKAAGVAEANGQHALDMAQKLSHQLRAAEDRIAELEADVQTYQERADRAEQWLHKIYTDVEERFIRQPEEKRRSVLALGRRA
jgi:hypothetical protein